MTTSIPASTPTAARTFLCELCGEPMPPGEEAFKYHGFSGPCPKPPMPPIRPVEDLTPGRKIYPPLDGPELSALRVVAEDPPKGTTEIVTYRMYGPSAPGAPVDAALPLVAELKFQHGPIPEAGVNGVTNEALLAVVIHRLERFQAGPYACVENATALRLARSSLNALHERTRDRQRRGVEGRHKA